MAFNCHALGISPLEYLRAKDWRERAWIDTFATVVIRHQNKAANS